MCKWHTHFSASVSGAFSRWGASEAGGVLPSEEMLGGEAAAVGERMDHRGSLSWGRYEIDCCRFVAGRFWGNGVVDDGETMSEPELEEVLESESMFEVARWNGRGGNECRLVGMVIFSKPSVDGTPATVSIEYGRRETQRRTDSMMCSVGNNPKFGV